MNLINTTFLAALLAGAAAPQEPAAQDAPAALKLQTLCPVSGKPVNDAIFVDYEGQRVKFCCKACPEKFAKFPDGVLFAMYQDGVRPDAVQTTCPVMDEPLENKDHYYDVLNKRIYTCCAKCLKRVAADPAKYLDALEGRKVQKACPVMGGEVDPEVSSVFQGQRIYYCCPGCEKKFAADPDKYYAAWTAAKVVTQPAAKTCPVSGMEAKGDLFLTWQGRRVNFCCTKCLTKFVADPAKHFAAL